MKRMTATTKYIWHNDGNDNYDIEHKGISGGRKRKKSNNRERDASR